MGKVVNIATCFEKFNDTYSPKIIGELNGQYVMVVKLEGDKCPWHTHKNEDEMFYVLEGILDIYDDKKKITVNAGEFYIVYQGKEHRVVPRSHVKLLLFEPAGIAHTGSVKSEITKSRFDRLDV
jgi:mannose-6-phosphate isomerase-like protein (cupin superfamily)